MLSVSRQVLSGGHQVQSGGHQVLSGGHQVLWLAGRLALRTVGMWCQVCIVHVNYIDSETQTWQLMLIL